jgi:hypothetical protein
MCIVVVHDDCTPVVLDGLISTILAWWRLSSVGHVHITRISPCCWSAGHLLTKALFCCFYWYTAGCKRSSVRSHDCSAVSTHSTRKQGPCTKSHWIITMKLKTGTLYQVTLNYYNETKNRGTENSEGIQRVLLCTYIRTKKFHASK